MTRTAKWFLAASFAASANEGAAWDHATANPCDAPVEYRAAPEAATGEAVTPYSATVELSLPLASRINTAPYNADLTRGEIDVGTALVTQDGSYLNVLGNDGDTRADPATGGCRHGRPHASFGDF